MTRLLAPLFCCAIAFAPIATVAAQTSQNPPESVAPAPSYAAVAKQVVGAPLIIDARISNASKLKPAESPGLAAGRTRYYIEADVQALIRGTSTVPARITFLADVPLDWRGRAPKLRKLRVLLFARPLPGRPADVQLTGIDGQRTWTPELDTLVRGIARDALAPDAPPAVTGIGNAFHVPGTLPGEGETQIFLTTANSQQISLQILRRPGQRPHWSVSTGDFIDESAGAPAKNTLLWFRLACSLPPALPSESLEADDPQNGQIAREDYQLVIRELGPCA